MPINSSGNSYQMVFPQGLAVAFDAEAFDQAIRTQGTALVHYRAMRCPVGLIDRDDIRAPHEDHENCSNGFIYTRAGEVTTLFTGNGLQVRGMEAGIMDSSTVAVTIPTTYDGSTEDVFVAPFDRLYLREPAGSAPILVTAWELVDKHITGYDRLMFPAVKVIDLMDSDGVRYSPGCSSDGGDFEVTASGQIHWLGRQPGVDPLTHRGKVYSIRYLYRPYFYVKQMLHEIRISQTDNVLTGERNVRRFAQSALLQREYVFQKNQNDPDSINPNDPRQIKSAPSGSFGAK